METNHPNTRYICDPVLGDNGKYYVPESLVELFRDKVISRAYMVTPNQFEASVLTGAFILLNITILEEFTFHSLILYLYIYVYQS